MAFRGNFPVRSQFIALSAIWVLWEILLVLRYSAGDYDYRDSIRREEAARAGRPADKRVRLGDGIARAQRLAHDLTVSFLLVLVVGYFAASDSTIVQALSWAYFAASASWIVVELAVNKAAVRIIMWIVKFGLLVAILGVAYSSQIGFNSGVNAINIHISA